MRKFTLLLKLIVFLCVSLEAFAQEDAGQQPVSLANQLENLFVKAGQFRSQDLRLDRVNDADRELMVYRRAERNLGLLRELNRLLREIAALPEDEPERHVLMERAGHEMTGAIDVILERTGNLSAHISRVREEVEASSGAPRIAHEAYLYSLRKLRIEYYESLGNAIEAKKAVGQPVEDEINRMGDQLYLFAEALAGRLEYSGAALTGLRAKLRANPDSAELIEAEKSFVGEHTQDLERLSAISKLLGRLGFDNAQYQSLLLKHGQSVSVRDFDSTLLKQQLQEVLDDAQAGMLEEAPDHAFRLFLFLLVLLVFYYLSRLTRRAVVAACERSGEKMSTLLKSMLASVSGAIVLGIGFLMALSQVGISLGPMLAGLGVAGFIVGFALQDTLGNFAAGGMILIYRPYDVGDLVEVAGAFGSVKKMSLVSTTITTLDNQTLVVPNSKIWGDVIKNVTAQRVRRVDMEFGISYSDDLEKAERILHAIIEQHELVLSSPEPTIKLHALADSSVNFVVRPWVKTADYWDVYWDVTREVKMRFDRENVSIPFPQRDVHIYHESG